MSDAVWKRIDSQVRPQRYAMLIKDEHYWHYTCQRAIEVFTRLWGGSGFIIVPTDGATIDENFWQILENYSPDFIGSYKPTVPDLKWAAPDDFESYIANNVERVISQGFPPEQAEKAIKEHLPSAFINSYELSSALKEQLRTRLSPFEYAGTVDRHNLNATSVPQYPFTRVVDILPNSKTKPDTIYIQKELSKPEYNLMAKMHTGSLSDEYKLELEELGVEVSTVLTKVPETDYLSTIIRGEVSRLFFTDSDGEPMVPDDMLSKLPISLPSSGLGGYRNWSEYNPHEDDVRVIIGDTIDDFCLAYSLSKLVNNVYWLPDQKLTSAHRLTEMVRGQSDDAEQQLQIDDNCRIISNLATEYYSNINRGGNDATRLVLTSKSLTKNQLANRRSKLISMAYIITGNPYDSTIIVSPSDIDVENPRRLLESNNYANQKAIAFVDNESVERLEPVKPKHFNDIDARNHRWIQTFQVQGFSPPILPGVGSEIFKNASSWHVVRSGKDGISFLLPGSSFFTGNDIDTTISRPDLKLLTSAEMFAHYFAGKYLVLPSDKGKYFDDTISKFGDIESAAIFFKNKQYIKLLTQFTDAERIDEKSRRDERIHLNYSSRAYLDIAAFKKSLGRKVNASNLIDYLLSIKVLRRGLILYCTKCSCSAWYDNVGIGQDFVCVRCRTRQPILKENWKHPDEPSWYYDLAETVHQFYANNSHITLLAIHHIKAGNKNFHYLPEVKLHKLEDGGGKIEIDFACIKDGYIYIGEAKSRTLQSNDLTKYINIFRQMTPHPHKLVFATDSSTVPRAVHQKAKRAGVDKNIVYVRRAELFA